MRDRETDTHQVTDNIGWGTIDKRMTAIFLQTAIATTLDPDVTGTPLVVTLVKRTCGGLGDVNVFKVSEDAQPRRAVTVSEHRPQTVPAVTLLELEHDPKVCLIPGRLLGTSRIKRFVTHCNRGASVDSQIHIGLAAALWEHPM